MKVVILAGGLGTRLSEETHLKPKPMVEIGGKPIIWHIMKSFSSHGFNEFIICFLPLILVILSSVLIASTQRQIYYINWLIYKTLS